MTNSEELIKCYQIQIIKNKCKPVYLGSYPHVPLPVLKIINHKNYILQVVAYVLTEDEIKNYNIVGVVIFNKKDNENSICSFDLVYEDKKYKFYYNDHNTKKEKEVKVIKNDVNKDNIMTLLIEGVFNISPTKEMLL